MFGSLVNALKGIGSGLKSAGSAFAQSMKDPQGGFDWGKLAQMGEGFSSGVKTVDPNSQMASIGEGLAGGIRAGSRMRAGRALDRLRNVQANAPIQPVSMEESGLADAQLTPPAGESALERLKRGGYYQTY